MLDRGEVYLLIPGAQVMELKVGKRMIIEIGFKFHPKALVASCKVMLVVMALELLSIWE